MNTVPLTIYARILELSAAEAIHHAVANGYRIDKAADPTAPAVKDIDEFDAYEVAESDVSLLSIVLVG
jgi:hypothetical protein